MAVRIPVTDLWMKVVSIKMRRRLEEELKKKALLGTCPSKTHLCPNHIMEIFVEILSEHTLVIDDGPIPHDEELPTDKEE